MPFNKDNGTAGLISQEESPSTCHLLFPPTFSLCLPPLSSTQLLLSNAPTPVFFPFKAPHYSAVLLLLFFPSSPSASPPTPLHLSIVLSFALSWPSLPKPSNSFPAWRPVCVFLFFFLGNQFLRGEKKLAIAADYQTGSKHNPLLASASEFNSSL